MSKPTSGPPATGLATSGLDTSVLTHLNERGEANMVDVSDKQTTHRAATACGFVTMKTETLALIETGQAKKGDVLATARIAGIMAAKQTHSLIPLCHPLAITKATVDFELSHDPVGINVRATVKVSGQTGVEMEALTAVSVACLTIYDMLKAVDKAMTFTGIKLLEKSGGRSGRYTAAKDKAGDLKVGTGQAPKSVTKSKAVPRGDPPPAASGDPPWDL